MSDAAHVKSIDALREFRTRLIEFQVGASNALESIGQQTQRCQEWLDHDRPLFWKNEVLRGSDRVAEARVALGQCRLRRVDGQPPSCFDEQKSLEAARHRLTIAEQKVRDVKHWSREVAQEAMESAGRIGQLQDALHADLPKSIAALERIIDSVEEYLNISPVANDRAEKPRSKPPQDAS